MSVLENVLQTRQEFQISIDQLRGS